MAADVLVILCAELLMRKISICVSNIFVNIDVTPTVEFTPKEHCPIFSPFLGYNGLFMTMFSTSCLFCTTLDGGLVVPGTDLTKIL